MAMADRYFVFPSWARFAFAWKELPDLFPFPEKYGLGPEMKKSADLGYSVSRDDHRFIDGPEGGGLIVARRETRRWFPMELMRTQCSFETPPGFDRSIDYGIHILVPALRAGHKLGEVPVPLTPSPLFSVEPISGEAPYCFFAFAFDKKGGAVQAPAAFPSLDRRIEPIDGVPGSAQKAFERIQEKGRHYSWYRILHSDLETRALIAVFIYLGLDVAGRANGSLRVMHTFCTEFLPGVDYPSAANWKQSVGMIRKATDW